LVIAIVGVMLGGVRHGLTQLGVILLVVGLLGLSMLAEPITRFCS
jgi:hypothetical protein